MLKKFYALVKSPCLKADVESTSKQSHVLDIFFTGTLSQLSCSLHLFVARIPEDTPAGLSRGIWSPDSSPYKLRVACFIALLGVSVFLKFQYKSSKRQIENGQPSSITVIWTFYAFKINPNELGAKYIHRMYNFFYWKVETNNFLALPRI